VARVLAYRLVRAGHEVALSDLDGPESLGDLPDRVGAVPGKLAHMVGSARVAVLAIPFGRYRELPPEPFRGRVTVDASNYRPDRDGPVPALETATSSELLARHLAGTRLVKAFNTEAFRTLSEVGPLSGDVARPAIPLAGDDAGAKAVVAELVVDLGFDPVDAGSLAEGWRLQPGSPAFEVSGDVYRVSRALTDA
jgi:predicted dinucleotide-binding enzyme